MVCWHTGVRAVESDGARSERAFFCDAGVKKDSRARFFDILKLFFQKIERFTRKRDKWPICQEHLNAVSAGSAPRELPRPF